MIVKCKLSQCPYYKDNFCIKSEVVGIDQNGMCSVPWRKGQQRILQRPFTDELYPKKKINIVDAIKYEEKEEEAEDQSKEDNNGSPA